MRTRADQTESWVNRNKVQDDRFLLAWTLNRPKDEAMSVLDGTEADIKAFLRWCTPGALPILREMLSVERHSPAPRAEVSVMLAERIDELSEGGEA